jgi:hypothetical protein
MIDDEPRCSSLVPGTVYIYQSDEKVRFSIDLILPIVFHKKDPLVLRRQLDLSVSLHDASGRVQSEQAVQAADVELGTLVDILRVQLIQGIHPLLSWRLTR